MYITDKKQKNLLLFMNLQIGQYKKHSAPSQRNNLKKKQLPMFDEYCDL